MRILGWMAQITINPVNQLFRDGMLKGISLLMHFIPGIAQDFHQKRLQKAVATDHGNGRAPTCRSETNPSIRLVFHQAGIDHTRERARNGRLLHAGPFSDIRRVDWAIVPLLQIPNDFEVVLDIGGKLNDVHVHSL